jgi:hypothetical protein
MHPIEFLLVRAAPGGRFRPPVWAGVFPVLWLLLGWVGAGPTARAEDEPRPLFVEGYAGRVSYAPGEELTLHVSSSAPRFAVEIARIGAKVESVWTREGVEGREHPVPEDASSAGCRWPSALAVRIPAEWRSGYYQVTLRVRDSGGKYVQRNARAAEGTCYFVLRASEPGATSKVLLQLSTHTYNAYNNWGGFSLYAYHGRGGNQGHRVSIERPPASQFGNWERPFVEWAERAGYALEYAANDDLEFRPDLLKGYRLVLSVGHDEYWSAPMRDHLERFIGEGGQRRVFFGEHLLLAGAERGRGPGADLLEAGLPS